MKMSDDYIPMSMWEIRNESQTKKMEIINNWRIDLLTEIQFLEKFEIERLKEKKIRMEQRLNRMPDLLAKAQKEYLFWINNEQDMHDKTEIWEENYQDVRNDYLRNLDWDKRTSNKIDDYWLRLNGWAEDIKINGRDKEWKDIDDENYKRRQFYDGIFNEKQVKVDIRNEVELLERQSCDWMAPRIENAIRRYREK